MLAGEYDFTNMVEMGIKNVTSIKHNTNLCSDIY